MTHVERLERAGLVFAFAVILVMTGLIVAQAFRILERERQYDAEQARRDRCSDLGEWDTAECND